MAAIGLLIPSDVMIQANFYLTAACSDSGVIIGHVRGNVPSLVNRNCTKVGFMCRSIDSLSHPTTFKVPKTPVELGAYRACLVPIFRLGLVIGNGHDRYNRETFHAEGVMNGRSLWISSPTRA